MAYDPVGAMGGLFAPAYIHGNPESEAATAKWQAENFAVTPEMIEASRGPGKTIATSPVANAGIRGNTGGGTMTIPGSVDPVALQIYAQGGKYTPAAPVPAIPAAPAAPIIPGAGAAVNPQRNAIAGQIMASGGLRDNQFAGLMGVPGEGMQRPIWNGSWEGGA